MTVSTELSHEEYVGNGVTTDFDFRFRIFESKHLIVVVADSEGNETTLKNGTDYTIVGAGSYHGGKVVLNKPLAQGWKILLERDLPVVQETDLRNQGKFFAEVHEDAFDYLTMLIQKALGTFSLSLRKPTYLSNYYDAKGNRIANLAPPKLGTDSANKDYVDNSIKDIDSKTLRVKDKPIPALPSAEQRRNKQLGFDNEGYPQLLDPVETGSLGYILVDSFEKGAEITTRYQALHFESNGEYYRWDGDLPKSILVNSTPENSGGIGLGRWISVGDSSLRGQLNNCFTDVSELRKSKNLNVNIPIVLINYNRNINGGGGAFYVDSNDTITPDNSGTVFINKSGQRIKRILSNICRWEDFGIINNSPLVTKENCEAAFKWGFENGYTKFETSISEITLDFP
ncbi:tail fiber/spike domain-containing protein, partial [Proteus terrae]|uniref:tail fiber/spike domain-containing protein n=1 Tax=Proteus terrae TaxID=1574161 RepID=UPI00405614D7